MKYWTKGDKIWFLVACAMLGIITMCVWIQQSNEHGKRGWCADHDP